MVGISLEFHVMNSPYDPIEHKGYPSRGQAPEIYATRLKNTLGGLGTLDATSLKLQTLNL